METAKAALQSDIASGQPYDSKRRNKLLKELNQANDRFLSLVTDLARKSAK